MATQSNSQPQNSDLDKLSWEFINDPLEAEIEEELEAEIQEVVDLEVAQLGGNNTSQRQSGTRRYIDRNREDGNRRLQADYFCDNPVYTDAQFRWRFRMKRPLFECIVHTLGEWSPYFRQRVDAFGKQGFSPLLKCTIAMRMLAYGSLVDLLDEGLRIAESTAIECLTRFVKGIRVNFGAEYLRRPTQEDTQRLLHVSEARGFPGMLGSLDCMHWHWKSCPVAWKGQYTRGDQGVSTIMLEAAVSHDLWI
jgi:hypothetical protein